MKNKQQQQQQQKINKKRKKGHNKILYDKILISLININFIF